MSFWKIALTDQTTGNVVPAGQLTLIAGAIQQQVDNDLAPAWGVRADISVLAAGAVVPDGTWPVYVVDSLPGVGGVHRDPQGKPYAQAVNGPDLSTAISHEVLEMLVDPWGNRFTQGPGIDPNFPGRQVFYLVEVCDPCQASSYPIVEVQVSDFVFPSFYDPNGVAPFDRCNTLAGPLPNPVPQHCYISWMDPGDWKWHQQILDGTFVTADATLTVNPRQDRDNVFGDDDGDDGAVRHNIPTNPAK